MMFNYGEFETKGDSGIVDPHVAITELPKLSAPGFIWTVPFKEPALPSAPTSNYCEVNLKHIIPPGNIAVPIFNT